MIENWFNAFNATEGEFVLVMGDDDTIFRFTENPAFNNLPGDVVGIKPCVFAYAGHRGILNMNASPIQAAKASDRISENLQSSSGSNLGIFSFWRRSVFQSLMELWFLHHPTRGTYCDWALMNGLVSSGKVVVDPSACYFYNLQNWAGDTEAILRQVEWAFTSSGLPKGSSAYARLFNAIDSYIFVGRKDSPLSPHERKTASMFCLEFYLKDFITNLPRQTAHENAKEILQLSERLAGNHSVTSIFERISDVCSAIRPGLGVEYKDFCGFATGKPWGAC